MGSLTGFQGYFTCGHIQSPVHIQTEIADHGNALPPHDFKQFLETFRSNPSEKPLFHAFSPLPLPALKIPVIKPSVIPTTSKVTVPITPIMRVCQLHSSHFQPSGRFLANVAHAMERKLARTATMACQLFTHLNARPRRKRPITPPPAIPPRC